MTQQLISRLENETDSSLRLSLLFELTPHLLTTQQRDVLPYFEEFVDLASTLEIKDKHAWALHFYAVYLRHTSSYSKAMDNARQAMLLFEEVQDENGISACYNNMGVIFHFTANYPEALKCYLKSLTIKEKIGNTRDIAVAYNNIGNVHFARSNYSDAEKNYQTAIQLYTQIDDKKGIAQAMGNLGNVCEKQKKYTKAIEFFQEALLLAQSINDLQTVANNLGNIGIVYMELLNFEEALKSFTESIELKKSLSDKAGIVDMHYNIGSAHKKKGDFEKAIESLKLTIESSKTINHRNAQRAAAKLLAQIQKAQQNYEDALYYHEEFHQLDSELNGEHAQEQLVNLSFHHNLEKTEKQLEIEQVRNVELKRERDRSDALLLNILPSEVAEELKQKGNADAKLFNDVTVFFSDFKSFTTISEKLTPQELVNELHECFSAFDNIIHKYGIEKIKTVGDAYLCVAGLPTANPNHAEDMIKAAIEIQNFIATRVSKAPLGGLGAVRIGINSGSVVAGIVGVKKFAYDIWGDTVNIAARMEQNGEAGKVNISEATYELVKDKYTCEYRGEIEAKNKGKLKMYFVEGV